MRIFALLLLLATPAWAADELTGSFEAGHQFAVQLNSGDTTRERPYVTFRGKYEFAPDETAVSRVALTGALRGSVDKAKEGLLDIRALHVGYGDKSAHLTLGFQEIPWGQTFGSYPADLVSPRDLRDPLFNEPSWVRLPVFTLNTEFATGRWHLQTIVTPVPRRNRYPDRFKGMKVNPGPDYEFGSLGSHTELGLKTGYEFESGWKLDLLYLWHYNRNPVFELIPSAFGPVMEPVVDRTHTAGFLINRSFGSWILRNDTLVHFNQFYQNGIDENPYRTTVLQSVLGADLKLPNEWEFGVQYQVEYWLRAQRHWAGVRVHKYFLNRQLEPELYVFQGLNNSDLWIQPKLTWHFLPSWSASLRADLISKWSNQSAGYLGNVDGQSRLMTWLEYKL